MEYAEQRLFVFYVHPQRAERTLPIDMVTKRPDEVFLALDCVTRVCTALYVMVLTDLCPLTK